MSRRARVVLAAATSAAAAAFVTLAPAATVVSGSAPVTTAPAFTLLGARVSPQYAYVAGRPIRIDARIAAPAPVELQLDVVREATGRPVRPPTSCVRRACGRATVSAPAGGSAASARPATPARSAVTCISRSARAVCRSTPSPSCTPGTGGADRLRRAGRGAMISR